MHILPLDESLIKAIYEARRIIKAILQGKDTRLLVVLGPCSLHDEKSALEYAEKLKKAADQYSDQLYVVMRTYFAKPRTTKGWKGLIYDPFLNESHDMEQGLLLTRKILLQINRLLPAACEFLDLITPCYFQDLISWSAIGARTTASQTHRELASGLPMPVGFKNSIDGNIQIAIDAAQAAAAPHHYLGLNAEASPVVIQTLGNEASHIILRGSPLSPNYSAEHIHHTVHALLAAHLEPRLIIDCSHDNCGKRYKQQAAVVDDLSQRIKSHQHHLGSFPICGVMLESHLLGGQQALQHPLNLRYGQSITDPCLSWQETEPLLEKLAMAVQAR